MTRAPLRSLRGHRSAPVAALALTLVVLGGGSPLDAQADPRTRRCELCHGELEFLRQHVPTLDDARRLLASRQMLDASAHRGMECAQCHSGFERFPHPEGEGRTDACASCHPEPEEAWARSVHAQPDREALGTAECTACHGVHDVLPASDPTDPAFISRGNQRCVACHGAGAMPRDDPHADSVACSSCHAAHATRDVDEAGARVAPHNQLTTCGACHEEPVAHYRDDVHGRSLLGLDARGGGDLETLGPAAPPTCTACHGGHGMLAPSHPGFAREMVDRCADCHGEYTERYFGTYHGKATALGSEIVATCDACHGSHSILPAADPGSAVAPQNLVETCGACHPSARPAFVEYDSHPDPLDRSRNAPLYFSFVFMNVLLVGVLIVFGMHTFLWWLRLMLDRRGLASGGTGASHE